MPVLNPKALIENRVDAIRAMHAEAGLEKAEIDVSGGIDSAILVNLLARALGPENVIAVHSQINSNPDALLRAREACEVTGVKLVEVDLTPIYEDLTTLMIEQMLAAGYEVADTKANPAILGSIRSTIRAPIGRGFNRLFNGGIRHGTGNECEDRWTRFFQKGGDGEVDSNPIAMLSKAEVGQLAIALGVPKSIITATPSPDLWGSGDAHNDEDEFADYFGFKASDYGQTFYGYVDSETGAYTKVGLIERVSRYLDETYGTHAAWVVEDHLFAAREPDWEHLLGLATRHILLSGLGPDLITKLLQAARRIERQTHHKMNPNCPSLGERSDLIAAGILTNTLPNLA